MNGVYDFNEISGIVCSDHVLTNFGCNDMKNVG